MRHRAIALLAVAAAALAVAGSAAAFDCIRVSSSYQGLVKSTSNSGNWTLFDFSSPTALASTLSEICVTLDSAQAECVYESYAASGQTQYFALGTGVAGKKTSTSSQAPVRRLMVSASSPGTTRTSRCSPTGRASTSRGERHLPGSAGCCGRLRRLASFGLTVRSGARGQVAPGAQLPVRKGQ